MKISKVILFNAITFLPLISMAEQVCNEFMVSTKLDTRYVVADGIVTDLQTNLQWSQCSIGQNWTQVGCEGEISVLTWKDALDQSESSEYKNIQDWRLPNVKELKSLVDSTCMTPSINDTIFMQTQSGYYWTSTPSVDDALRSYIVDFSKVTSNY